MRVIVLSDYGYINGGAAQVAISSLNALAEAGVDVTFVSAVGPIDPTINRSLVKTINFGFYDLLSNPSRVDATITGIWNSASADKFGEVLADFDPSNTIIHLHTWVKSLSSSVVQLAVKRGFKIVCTLHDYFSICPNGGLYNYKQQKHCELSPMSFNCITSNCDSRSYVQKLWRVGRQVVQKKFGGIPNDIKNFITVSDYAEALLLPWLPMTANFYRVRNPIEINKVTPSDVANNYTFTFVGRLSPEKGCVQFAIAARMAGVEAVFVGSGEEEANIRAANPRARFLGWQNREGVIRTIQSSRAIVFSSLLHETQGMVVIEATALGVPSIVADACAASSVISDGKTGLLFLTRNLVSLAEKLMLLNDNPQLAAELGRRAFENYWLSPCTMASHLEELICCYTRIMNTTEC